MAREQSNKMTLWNVSTVMAPNLFLHRGQPPKLLKGKEKQLAEGAAEVVQMMVHYQDLLWTVRAVGQRGWRWYPSGRRHRPLSSSGYRCPIACAIHDCGYCPFKVLV